MSATRSDTEETSTGAEHVPPTDLSSSPVHVPGHTLRWTTANVDEGLPGTVSPLTWSMYFPPTEQTMRDCWVDLGVLPASARPIPTDVDQRFLSVAYGHAIANVDQMGQMAARIPGGSAAMMEEQLFGSVQAGGLPEPKGWNKVRRYPYVAIRFPRTLRRAMADFGPLAEETELWWSRRAFALADAPLAEAVSALVEARSMFVRGLSVHMVLSMAAQGVMGQVETMAARAGVNGGDLIRSTEGTAEFELVRDLWALAADRLDITTFSRRHGYHGPREGLVESVVWREDPAPVLALLERYRARADGGDLDAQQARLREQHAAAVARLQQSLGPVRRRVAEVLIRFAARVPVWRETGRANILRGVDVARAAARTVGVRLADAGHLADPSDVFFLTIDEINTGMVGSFRGLVERRRADHMAFEQIRLPHVWHGVPQPITTVPSPASEDVQELHGIGVSVGVAEGVVRVIVDLDDAEIDDGTVMVCKATDPSWASLFPLAEAVVTDVGSAMSHAAIVCRELGLPCVANTRSGTAQLRDGMRVRVDGTAGTVLVIGDS